MTIFRTRGGRLAVFYTAVAITFCIIWAKPVQIHWGLSTQEENIRLDRAPKMTHAELQSEGQSLRDEAIRGATDDPLDYWRFLNRRYRFQAAFARYTRDGGTYDRELAELSQIGLDHTVQALQTSYHNRYTAEKMSTFAKEGQGVAPYSPVRNHPTGVSYWPYYSAFGEAYVECMLLALFFFVGRLEQSGKNILVEFFWRLPLMAVVWFPAVFFYPVRVDPRRQLQRARQFAAFCLSSIMSFAGMATTGAYAQSAGKTTRGSAHSLAVEAPSLLLTSQVWSKKVLKNGRVPEQGAIVQSDATATWKNGFYVNVFGQDNFEGHTGAGQREIDGAIGWGGKFLHLDLSYFNVSPMFRNPKGNVLTPRIELDLPTKIGEHYRFSPFVRFEWLQTFRKARSNSGSLSIVGVKDVWQLPHGVSITQALWALYDSSVFGSDRGWMGRYKVGLHIAIGHGITFDPLLVDVSMPLSGIDDRKVETAFGMGLSFQH